jgi:hypothetical protein
MGWGLKRMDATTRGALLLAALAVFLHAAIPAGFMLSPAQSQKSLPAMVICTGQGMMVLSDDGKAKAAPDRAPSPTSPEKSSAGHACVFASATAPVTAPEALGLPLPALAWREPPSAGPAHHQSPGLGLAAPPPPTTGPPLSI